MMLIHKRTNGVRWGGVVCVCPVPQACRKPEEAKEAWEVVAT